MKRAILREFAWDKKAELGDSKFTEYSFYSTVDGESTIIRIALNEKDYYMFNNILTHGLNKPFETEDLEYNSYLTKDNIQRHYYVLRKPKRNLMKISMNIAINA